MEPFHFITKKVMFYKILKLLRINIFIFLFIYYRNRDLNISLLTKLVSLYINLKFVLTKPA